MYAIPVHQLDVTGVVYQRPSQGHAEHVVGVAVKPLIVKCFCENRNLGVFLFFNASAEVDAEASRFCRVQERSQLVDVRVDLVEVCRCFFRACAEQEEGAQGHVVRLAFLDTDHALFRYVQIERFAV